MIQEIQNIIEISNSSVTQSVKIRKIQEIILDITDIDDPLEHPQLHRLKLIVATYKGISLERMLIPTNKREISDSRHVYFYFAKILLEKQALYNCTIKKIAKSVNLTNHATVIHGHKKIKGLIEFDKSVAKDLEGLKQIIEQEFCVLIS